MKNRVVKSIRTHVGVHVENQELTSITEKHSKEMELLPTGVLVKNVMVKGVAHDLFVPHTNIHFAVLASEEAATEHTPPSKNEPIVSAPAPAEQPAPRKPRGKKFDS
jgi:hypothetical protein